MSHCIGRHGTESTNLELYVRGGSVFCQQVIDYIDTHRINVIVHDLGHSPAIEERLKATSGSSEVPCLTVAGTPVHGADVIVDWLKSNVVWGLRKQSRAQRCQSVS